MSDRRKELFQAVLAEPGNDSPRLAYAGFCDAQGDPYGQFIRAQLARTEALRHGSRDDAFKHGEEAARLARAHRDPSWTHGVEKLGRGPSFIRGFVESIIVDGERYLEIADELYRTAPIRHLVLSEVGPHIAAIARDPHLAQVVSLSIANTSGKRPIGDDGLRALAESPYLGNLKVLDVSHQGLTRDGLEALCASRALPSLVDVGLAANAFEDPKEDYSEDWATRIIIGDSIRERPLGAELERKFGVLPWLHGPSRLRHFPPLDEEL